MGADEPGHDASIRAFLACSRVAVVGASNHPMKFGGKVLAACLRHGRVAFPVNPRERQVLGIRCVATLRDLPEAVEAVSIVTPPAVTERIVEDAAAAGARRVWMQPGAESPRAVARAKELGLDVIAGGPCLIVELDALDERPHQSTEADGAKPPASAIHFDETLGKVTCPGRCRGRGRPSSRPSSRRDAGRR